MLSHVTIGNFFMTIMEKVLSRVLDVFGEDSSCFSHLVHGHAPSPSVCKTPACVCERVHACLCQFPSLPFSLPSQFSPSARMDGRAQGAGVIIQF